MHALEEDTLLIMVIKWLKGVPDTVRHTNNGKRSGHTILPGFTINRPDSHLT